MNATQRGFLSNLFGWAEHEVEANVKRLTDALGTLGQPAEPMAGAVSQQAFDALKERLDHLEADLRDQIGADAFGARDAAAGAGATAASSVPSDHPSARS